jgi:hypothetical protein
MAYPQSRYEGSSPEAIFNPYLRARDLSSLASRDVPEENIEGTYYP